ncbi:MAG TPA: carboxypeptidase-like regulatory domain-containing protein, partial [Pyrinomonadaceae bacterium]
MKNRARSLARWLMLAPALAALACAFIAPAEAGRAPARAARRPPAGEARRPPAARRAAQDDERQGAAQDDERQSAEPADDSTVRGRAVYDDTNRPVRRANVVLFGDGPRTEYSALTDARGEFSVGGVKAGTYLAFVDAPGALSPLAFVSLDELRSARAGMPDLGEGRALFDTVEVDGKRDVTVTVRARRGAAISGRVAYADGEPAVNVSISLMRRGADGRLLKFVTGANIVSLAGLRTDDRGVFRLTGLPPGEYFVAAVEPVEHGTRGVRDRRRGVDGVLEGIVRPQLLVTFHPSAASAKDAAAIRVVAGEERADVDVRIPERELRTVAGFARARRGGRPLKGARVTI